MPLFACCGENGTSARVSAPLDESTDNLPMEPATRNTGGQVKFKLDDLDIMSARASLAKPVRTTNDKPVERDDEALFIFDPRNSIIMPRASERFTYGLAGQKDSSQHNFKNGTQPELDTLDLFTPCASIVMGGPSNASFNTSFASPAAMEEGFDNSENIRQTINAVQERVALTSGEQTYVNAATSQREKIQRLMEVEEKRRSEIYATWALTAKMLDFGTHRVKPVLRTQPSKLIAMRSTTGYAAVANMSCAQLSRVGSLEASLSKQGRDTDPQLPARLSMVGHPMDVSTALIPGSDTDETPVPMQLLKISGQTIPIGHKCEPYDAASQWDFLSLDGVPERLCRGECCFGFKCCKLNDLHPEDDLPYVRSICGLSGFKPNDPDYIPEIDWHDNTGNAEMTIVMVKTMYIAPGFDCTKLSLDHFTTLGYQKACQPGKPSFDEATFKQGNHTMRFKKTIVNVVFSLTIQLKVHEITDQATLREFKNVDGIVPAKIFLMERTKKNKKKSDGTVMMKSLLLYYPITGGTLICNFTNVVNKAVPGWIAKIVNAFGSSGMAEAAETATLTKAHLYKTYGDARK